MLFQQACMQVKYGALSIWSKELRWTALCKQFTCACLKVSWVWSAPLPTGLCCVSVAKSPCNSTGSGRLWDFRMICYAVTVALLLKFSRLILQWALSTRSAGVLNSWMPYMVWKGALISSIAWEHYKRSHSQNLLLMWRRGWGVSGARQTG